MQDNEKDFDQLIKETLNEKLEQLPSPPLSINESWEDLQNRKKKRNRPHINSRIVIAAASALFIVGSVMFYSPTSGSAFNHLIDVFHKVQGTVTQLFISAGGNTGDKHAPPMDGFTIVEGSEVTSQSMNLDEAQAITSFDIMIPKEIPPTYVLKSVTVLKRGDEKSDEIYLNYEGEQGELMITQKRIRDQFGIGISVDNEDTVIEDVNINGHKANLLLFKNDVSELIWITQNFYFTVEGKLTKDEIVQIAKSM